MEISAYMCGCCGVSDIKNLGMHKNAQEAMLAFCRQELPSFGSNMQQLNVYYVFTAGPEVPRDHPGGSHHSKAWVKYGTEFAAFILDNGLGDIATLGQHLNLKYHAHSTCQVWIWHPNQKAMVAWWKANNPALKPKEAKSGTNVGA